MYCASKIFWSRKYTVNCVPARGVVDVNVTSFVELFQEAVVLAVSLVTTKSAEVTPVASLL